MQNQNGSTVTPRCTQTLEMFPRDKTVQKTVNRYKERKTGQLTEWDFYQFHLRLLQMHYLRRARRIAARRKSSLIGGSENDY